MLNVWNRPQQKNDIIQINPSSTNPKMVTPYLQEIPRINTTFMNENLTSNYVRRRRLRGSTHPPTQRRCHFRFEACYTGPNNYQQIFL